MKDPVVLQVGKIQQYQREFVAAREWDQFHNPKNLAMALAGEVGELLELFQWLTAEQSQDIMKDPQKQTAVKHEIADIIFYVLRIADKLGVDLEAAVWEKLEQNAKRYPVELAKGNAKKYTEF